MPTPAEKLLYLQHDKIGNCTRCGLHTKRNTIVFGDGAPGAAICFVGEAPGADEDKSGHPFVGAAGRLLNNLLFDVGLHREGVYICNVVKCRPPGNRDPEPDEIAACSPFLHAQIFLVQPKVLVAVGRYAGNLLSGQIGVPMGKLREQVLTYRNEKTGLTLPVVAMYHPAYLLRQIGSLAEKETRLKMLADLNRAIGEIKAE